MNRQVDIKALVSHIVRGDGLEKCRICMGDTSEGQVYLGDTVMMDGDRAVTLAELLEIITGIEVETDLLPNRICEGCANSIAPTIQLIEHLRDVHRKWNDASDYILRLQLKSNVKTAYIVVDNDVKDVTTYTENIRSSDSIEHIYRSFKKRKSQQNALRRRHEKERQLMDSEILTSLKCHECDKSFLSVYKFNVHMRPYDKRACVHCLQMIKVEHLKDHYYEHDIETPQCDVCYETFKRSEALAKHKEVYHSKGPYLCYICKLSYRDPQHLASHMTSKHETRVCLGCDRKFSNVYCFRTHSKKCKNSKSKGGVFICDVCAKVYGSKYALKVHIEYTHMNKDHSHQCEHCGKVFTSGVHLLEHSNTHIKVPDRFVCGICLLPMSTRRGFQRHLNRHMQNPDYVPKGKKVKMVKKVYTYKCDLCVERFAFKKQFLKHMMTEHHSVPKIVSYYG